jgi:hypothetical protein
MGTWARPVTQDDRDRVDKILSRSLPCGKDGQNALNAIANLIGDDKLSDDIIQRAAKNPRYTANYLILEKLREWNMMDSKGKWIKWSALQEHFEQLGLDLGVMDKPNEN